MKGKIIIASIILSLASVAGAKEYKQHAYLSYYGNAPGAGINYEYNIYPNLWLGVGLAYEHAGIFDVDVSAVSIPVNLNYLFFQGSHKLELGAGVTFLSAKANDTFGGGENIKAAGLIPVGSFGYRYMPKESGFTFRATLHPVYNGSELNIGAGLGIGYRF